MKSGRKQQRARKKGTGEVYRIVVRGELSGRYATAFEGMKMETETGQTILTGVIDQPHLHGIFERISGLGLELLSVRSSSPEKTTEQAGSGGGGTAAMCTSSGQPERRTTVNLFGYFHPVVDLFGYLHPLRSKLRAPVASMATKGRRSVMSRLDRRNALGMRWSAPKGGDQLYAEADGHDQGKLAVARV